MSDTTMYHLLCILCSFLGTTLGFILLTQSVTRNKANVFLGALVLMYSLFFIPGFLEYLGLLEHFTFVIRLNFICGSLVGPLTYLYCKYSIQESTISFRNIYFHFIALILNVILFIPTLIKSPEEKIAIYYNTINAGKVPEAKWALLAFCIYTLLYTVISIRLVFRYLVHLRNTNSSVDYSFIKWLLFLCISLLLPIIGTTLIGLANERLVTASLVLCSLSSIIFIIYFSLTLRPKFFHFFPSKMEESISDSEQIEKYQGSNLQEHQKDNLLARLIEYMASEKPHLDPELNIGQLSTQLNIPTHYLSQIINEKLKRNFLDFVNNYRIEEAKGMLVDSRFSNYTILTIATEAGFNSKSTFYSVFKKNVGETPTQYKKNYADSATAQV